MRTRRKNYEEKTKPLPNPLKARHFGGKRFDIEDYRKTRFLHTTAANSYRFPSKLARIGHAEKYAAPGAMCLGHSEMFADAEGRLWRMICNKRTGMFYFTTRMRIDGGCRATYPFHNEVCWVTGPRGDTNHKQLRPLSSHPYCDAEITHVLDVIYDMYGRPVIRVVLYKKEFNRVVTSTYLFLMSRAGKLTLLYHAVTTGIKWQRMEMSIPNTVVMDRHVCEYEQEKQDHTTCLTTRVHLGYDEIRDADGGEEAEKITTDTKLMTIPIDPHNIIMRASQGGYRAVLAVTMPLSSFFHQLDWKVGRPKNRKIIRQCARNITALMRACQSPYSALGQWAPHLVGEIFKNLIFSTRFKVRQSWFGDKAGQHFPVMDAIMSAVRDLLLCPEEEICCGDDGVVHSTKHTFIECLVRNWCGDYHTRKRKPELQEWFRRQWRSFTNGGRWHIALPSSYIDLDLAPKDEDGS